MKRLIVRIAIALLGKEILDYFQEQADLSPYKNMSPLVARIKALFDEVPVDVWQSLRDEQSKAELKRIFAKHDQPLALAAYDLGIEYADKKIESDGYFLAPFEQAAYELGKNIVRIYTDDDRDNRKALETLFFENSLQLQLLSIDQLMHTLERTDRIAQEQKRGIRISLEIIRSIIKEVDNVQAQAQSRSIPA